VLARADDCCGACRSSDHVRLPADAPFLAKAVAQGSPSIRIDGARRRLSATRAFRRGARAHGAHSGRCRRIGTRNAAQIAVWRSVVRRAPGAYRPAGAKSAVAERLSRRFAVGDAPTLEA
jgi:hypothetical protein